MQCDGFFGKRQVNRVLLFLSFLPFTESQNHKMVKVGMDLWRSSGPNHLLRQGHLELLPQERVQTALEYLQGWRLHKLPGNLRHGSVTFTVKSVS